MDLSRFLSQAPRRYQLIPGFSNKKMFLICPGVLKIQHWEHAPWVQIALLHPIPRCLSGDLILVAIALTTVKSYHPRSCPEERFALSMRAQAWCTSYSHSHLLLSIII